MSVLYLALFYYNMNIICPKMLGLVTVILLCISKYSFIACFVYLFFFTSFITEVYVLDKILYDTYYALSIILYIKF